MLKKNNIKNLKKKAFGLAYATFIMVVIAVVGINTIQMVAETNSSTTKEHIKTQMNLYMDSTIEYSLLWLSQNQNFSQNKSTVTINYPSGYTFIVNTYPIVGINGANIPIESRGTVVIDIIGSYNDNEHAFSLSTRTVQKP